MNLPHIVCLCCTYNRPKLLAESIQCFLDQDYENKDLVILNDQEGVEIQTDKDYDQIHIYNHPERFNSLGEKRNYLKSIMEGDYYCIWDDDDLYVPFRLSESIYFFQQYPEYDILKPKDAFISYDNKDYKVATNRFHAQAIISKEYMEKTDYLPQSIGEDARFEESANIKLVDIFPSFWAILRYGMDTFHISQIPSGMHKESWEMAKTFSKTKEDYIINPELQHDYWGDIQKSLESINPIWGSQWAYKIGRI